MSTNLHAAPTWHLATSMWYLLCRPIVPLLSRILLSKLSCSQSDCPRYSATSELRMFRMFSVHVISPCEFPRSSYIGHDDFLILMNNSNKVAYNHLSLNTMVRGEVGSTIICQRIDTDIHIQMICDARCHGDVPSAQSNCVAATAFPSSLPLIFRFW